MAKYKISQNGVIRDDGACIPNDVSNRDWLEYQEWLLVDGNIPDPELTLEQAKSRRIDYLRSCAFGEINSLYPVYKQVNINELQGFTQSQKDDMWSFINSKRDLCNAREAAVAAATTIEAVDAVVW